VHRLAVGQQDYSEVFAVGGSYLSPSFDSPIGLNNFSGGFRYDFNYPLVPNPNPVWSLANAFEVASHFHDPFHYA
jgi:hypothetical protein